MKTRLGTINIEGSALLGTSLFRCDECGSVTGGFSQAIDGCPLCEVRKRLSDLVDALEDVGGPLALKGA
jgi:hypothetical protein